MAPFIPLFGLKIPSYLMTAVVGAITGAAMTWPALGKRGWSRGLRALTLALMCAGFLIFARLWTLAVTPGSYGPERPWYTLRLTGLSLYGGILGTFLGLLAAARLSRKDLLPALDAITFPGAAAFCIARVGCFLNGCCRGIATRLPWGVVFPSRIGDMDLSELGVVLFNPPVHPTQLYELLGAAVGIPLVLLFERRRSLPPGGRLLAYGVWFSAMRLCILPLRALRYPGWIRWGVYPALYLAFIAAGVLVLRRLMRAKAADSAENGE